MPGVLFLWCGLRFQGILSVILLVELAIGYRWAALRKIGLILNSFKSILKKHSLLATTVASLLPNIVGSIFNIWYNLTNIKPLLTEDQTTRFLTVVSYYNALVYPVLVTGVVLWLWSVRTTRAKLVQGLPVDAGELKRSQQKVINLPWSFAMIGCIGWFCCIPVFLYVMNSSSEPLHPHVRVHLPISFTIAGLIAVTQSLFVAEWCAVRLLYPTFFPDGGAAKTEGAYTLGLVGKGLIWAVAVVVCPVVSLLMLLVAPTEMIEFEWFAWFAAAVSAVSILFGLISAFAIWRLVTEPVDHLRKAAQRVGAGDLAARVDITRSDDFGPLIDEFNLMVSGLNEKQLIQETFGRHVGVQAAREIMAQGGELTGREKVISVMFVDLRNYTARSSNLEPAAVVTMLNLFMSEMVGIVESNNGMINKFLGDGFMALFGAAQATDRHADDAVQAGREMLIQMESVNRKLVLSAGDPELAIGIGIHTGPAIVGSIGSESRREYTAIGDTVNVASRIESLTKQLKTSLLFTNSTRDMLVGEHRMKEFLPQHVKGKTEPVQIFSVLDVPA